MKVAVAKVVAAEPPSLGSSNYCPSTGTTLAPRYQQIEKGSGVGLGLRRPLDAFESLPDGRVDFFEVAPENWIGYGGLQGKRFTALAERFPIFLHGLSLNLGGIKPLDMDLVHAVGDFMRRHGCVLYSEHLTACGDDGHFYDLMPIPFTMEGVRHVAQRIVQVQEALGQRITVENASYYLAPGQEMSELDFVHAVVTEADCDLLLDINNIVVNGGNHGYAPTRFVDELDLSRVRYLHIAGHRRENDQLCIDTHGMPVGEAAWALLDYTYERLGGACATLLERDNNLPPMAELLAETDRIRTIQARYSDVEATPQL